MSQSIRPMQHFTFGENSANDTLSRIASRLKKLFDTAEDQYEHDSHYDGGEFSGPAIFGYLELQYKRLLAEYGYEPDEFYEALAERVDQKSLFFDYPWLYFL